MRSTRKLLLFAVTATALLAMSASSASATSAISVVDEATNTACSSITSPHTNLSQGCAVHATGTIELQGWAFVWFHEATCKVELEMRVAGNGVSAVDDMDLYRGDTNCDGPFELQPATTCDLPWEGKGERVSATVIHAWSQVCINAPEIDTCISTLEYDVIESGSANAETYSVSFVNQNLGSFCRINGTLSIEKPGTDSPIHVN